MTIFVPGPTSRRAFLVGTTGLLAAATVSTTVAEDSRPVQEIKLTAAAGRVALVGKPHPDTEVWCYDGHVPGPEIRLRQGEHVRIIVQNNLSEGTTVHWHGIRLPIAMDGVPGISQPPIRPGESCPDHGASF
jgi:FtsP/CotA-like multicopper oxidase with cupredoxin domain